MYNANDDVLNVEINIINANIDRIVETDIEYI